MKLFLILTTALILYVSFDLVLDSYMWEANISVTNYLQTHIHTPFVFNVISFCLFVVPVLALIMFLFMEDKLGIILYLSMIIITASLNSSIKNLYHQERPYMDAQVTPLACEVQYGKPSGHAQSSIVMIFLFPAILFPGVFSTQTEKINFNIMTRIFIIFILVSCTLLTGLARVYLGVHSFGQVLLGWVYGGYTILIYMHYFHDKLRISILAALDPRYNQLSWRVVIISQLISIGWCLLNLIIYLWVQSTKIQDDQIKGWISQIEKCQQLPQGTYNKDSVGIIQNVTFIQSIVLPIISGMILGVKLVGGTYKEGVFNMNFQQCPMKNKVFRILLLIFSFTIIIPLMFIQSKNIYVMAFCKVIMIINQQFLVTYLIGLILLGVYPYLLKRANLGLQGDFIYIQDKYSAQELEMKEPC